MTTNTSLAAYNKAQLPQCHLTAMDQKRANPSDPSTYDRVMSHLLNGICLISDYSVQFRRETRITQQGASYSVEVPYNMKKGC